VGLDTFILYFVLVIWLENRNDKSVPTKALLLTTLFSFLQAVFNAVIEWLR
jgi:hypothetical protein